MLKKIILKSLRLTIFLKIILFFSLTIVFVLYTLIPALNRSDGETIKRAKDVDSFIIKYYNLNGKLPLSKSIRSQFPDLNTESGWFIFTDDSMYLKIQYSVKWSNGDAIGKSKTSEFTGTVYAYTLDYNNKMSK